MHGEDSDHRTGQNAQVDCSLCLVQRSFVCFVGLDLSFNNIFKNCSKLVTLIFSSLILRKAFGLIFPGSYAERAGGECADQAPIKFCKLFQNHAVFFFVFFFHQKLSFVKLSFLR